MNELIIQLKSSFIFSFFNRFSFSTKKRIAFYKAVSRWLANGIPLYKVLEKIEKDNPVNIIPQPILYDVMRALRGKNGPTFGAALAPHVPPLEAALIDAGERSGQISTGLSETVYLLKSRRRINKTIITRMAYPSTLLVVFFLVMYFISEFIVPKMLQMMPKEKWPASAYLIGTLSDYYWFITSSVLIATLGTLIAFILTVDNWRGPVRAFFDRFIPPWSISRIFQASMILISLSLLMRAGKPANSAIKDIYNLSSLWQQSHLDQMLNRMKEGMKEGNAIAGKGGGFELFDAYTAWDIRMHSDSQNFAEVMKEISDENITTTEEKLVAVMYLIGNLVLMLIAALSSITFSSFYDMTFSAVSMPF